MILLSFWAENPHQPLNDIGRLEGPCHVYQVAPGWGGAEVMKKVKCKMQLIQLQTGAVCIRNDRDEKDVFLL